MTNDPRAATAATPAPHAAGFRPEQSVRAPRPAPEADRVPVRWRELLAMLLIVVLSDLAIYRGQGFAGYAALFLAAPILLVWGAFRPRLAGPAWGVGLLLLVLAAKAIWCGSALLVALGFALLAAFVMALSGETPYVVETAVFASLAVGAGYKRLNHYGRRAAAAPVMQISWLNLTMPLAALVAFGTVFIFANPDLLAYVSETLEQVIKRLREWLLEVSVSEIAFWGAAIWIVTGLVRQASGATGVVQPADPEPSEPASPESSKLYPAFRNTLWTVIVLFAVYLVFEFLTLWFREFPKGFIIPATLTKGPPG